MASGDLIPRIYGGFCGVDFRGDEIDPVRSPDSLNMWKDYKETDVIRTRPKMKKYSSYTQKINGIFFYTVGETEMMIVHRQTYLYKVTRDAETGEEVKQRLYPPEGKEGTEYNLRDARSNAFIYNGIWYFQDGRHYLKYDGTTEYATPVVGYIPTTLIGGKPEGGGTTYEDVNLLSDYRKNAFVGDDAHRAFYLNSKNIDTNYKPTVTVNDVAVEVSSVDYAAGKVVLKEEAPSPATEGQSNVIITFKKTIDKSKILNCRLLEMFDNRVFFSGNPDYPNMIWHCSLDDPTYFSDLDYYNEGLDTAKVKGMVAGNNALWVFKEPSQANTTVFYHTPTIDADYGKIYPNTHSSISTGCVGKAINFNDDIIFFSDRGMEGISGDITSEQVIAHRSSLVDRKLTAERDYKNMMLVEWEGYLVVIIGKKVYLADSRAMFANGEHYEYEWFYWELPKTITCAKVHEGVLYLAAGEGDDAAIYTLDDMEGDVESYWVTPKDKFMHPHYLKTTNKRGCVAEAKGDISVYAKTEKTDFELINTYENVTDYFVCRIKRKKFKDIQLKFHSNTRFSLETATLECFIGGYLKR